MGLIDGKTEAPRFELVYYPKDSQGNPLSKRTVCSNDGFKIWRTWMNNQGKVRKKSKKQNKSRVETSDKLPVGKEADRIMKEAANYAEQKQAKKEGTEATVNGENS